jgi:hypothetical protein
MAWTATAILIALCVIMLGQGFVRREKAYGFPFLAAGMFLTFVLPQVPGLINDRFVSDEFLARAIFFSVSCLALIGLGWAAGMRVRGLPDFVFDEGRLLKGAAALSLVGAYFFYKFGQLPDEQRLRGFLTGAAVAYLFFAKLLTYGMAIAVLCFARRPSRLAAAIICFDALFYAERIVIAGRRSDLAELGMILVLAFWFQRGWRVPRTALAAGLVMTVVGLLGVGEYREATYYSEKTDWHAVTEIDLKANWDRLLSEGGPEMRNLVYAVGYMSRQPRLDFGTSTWNTLVASYVPAQIVGQGFKQSLMFREGSNYPSGYEELPGTTSTGMLDAFGSFWYFGGLKFFLIAAILGALYAAALGGNTGAQLVYILSAMPSMLVITHFTDEIVIAWVHVTAFLLPVLVWARVRPSAAGALLAPCGRG